MPTSNATRDPLSILVAEDNKYDQLILEEAFSELDQDTRLHFVANGEELLAYLRGGTARASAAMPSLVLMDLNMPRMNGNEALREMRADPILCMMPVIVLSTSDNPKQIAQAYANGVNAFMTKPGRIDDLVALLRRFEAFWLDGAKLPQFTN